MPFNSIKKFFERNSSLLAGVCCLLFAGLSLLGKLLEPVLSSDGAFYLQLVEIWRNAGHYDAVPAAIPDSDWIPAFPLFLIKCLVSCGIPPEVAGVGLPMLVGSTLPLLVYLMAQEIQSDKRISLAAALLITFNPPMIELGREVQRDMLYIGLCGWSIFFALKGLMRKSVWPWIPAGILGGCAMLTRYETFEMLPVLLFAFLLFGIKKELTWKKIGVQCAVWSIACIVTIGALIHVMGVQEYFFSAYSRYFSNKCSLLERTISDADGK